MEMHRPWILKLVLVNIFGEQYSASTIYYYVTNFACRNYYGHLFTPKTYSCIQDAQTDLDSRRRYREGNRVGVPLSQPTEEVWGVSLTTFKVPCGVRRKTILVLSRRDRAPLVVMSEMLFDRHENVQLRFLVEGRRGELWPDWGEA